jgi:hypothetical protein
MAKPSFIAGNLALGAVITASSEDAAFPKSNLLDNDIANRFKFTAGGSGQFVEFDILSAQSIDRVFIGNHNLDPTAVVTVKAGLSATPTTVFDTPTFRAGNMLARGTATAQFIRIEIDDAQPGGGVTQLGLVRVGLRTIFPRNVRFGVAPQTQQQVLRRRTNGGKSYRLQQFELERRRYTLRFKNSERATVRAWWDAIRGQVDSFVWMDEDGEEALFVSVEEAGFLPEELPEQAPDAILDLPITVIEEGAGVEILA